MIYTARQLEDLWKANGANGQVVLPYRARLSPLAADWLKSKKVTVGYSDVAPKSAPPSAATASPAGVQQGSQVSGQFIWWCDGPCGTAKAALMAQARESSLVESSIPNDSGRLVAAIKHLASEVKNQKAAGGVLMVNAGASALVYANRCPSLRAIVGTCLETVEQGIQQVAANVLIVEYPHKTLQQVRNMLSRFCRANRQLSEEAKKHLQELSSCA